jgi:hypothetical protein
VENASRFSIRRSAVAKVLGCAVGIIFLVGLLVITGVFKLIF